MSKIKGEDKELLSSLGLIDETQFQKRPRLRTKRGVNKLSEAIAIERVRLGYTQRELAEQIPIGFETLRRIEQGNEKVQMGLYLKVMDFLGLKAYAFRKSELPTK